MSLLRKSPTQPLCADTQTQSAQKHAHVVQIQPPHSTGIITPGHFLCCLHAIIQINMISLHTEESAERSGSSDTEEKAIILKYSTHTVMEEAEDHCRYFTLH